MIFILSFCTACEDKDIVLMNELKTLDAKWIRLAEQVSELKHITAVIQQDLQYAAEQMQGIEEGDTLYADSILMVQTRLIQRSDSIKNALPIWQKSYAYEKELYDTWYAQVPLVKSKAEGTRKEIQAAAEIINKLSQEAEQMKQTYTDVVITHNAMREEVIRKIEWIQYDAISLR